MKRALLSFLCLLLPVAVATSGCEDGGGGNGGGSSSGTDSSGNDAGLVVCIGDSITAGQNCDGAPYPSRLAALSGKKVVNLGSGGAMSAQAPAAASSAVARKPAWVCILYGSNDATHGVSPETVKENLRAAVATCKAAGAKPVLGTPPPQILGHRAFADAVERVRAAVVALGKEEGVPVADLWAAMSSDPEKWIKRADGLHLTDAGGGLVASKFNERIR